MCWPGAQSARDNHVLASNFAKKFTDFKKIHSQTQRLTCLNLIINNPTTP